MTSTSPAAAPATAEQHARHVVPTGGSWVLRDSWTEATRHLRIIPRNSELLVFSTIQPIMFVLLFVYVFGGPSRCPATTPTSST